MEESRMSVNQLVANRFVQVLSQGKIPWEKPWVSLDGVRCGAWSHKDGIPYSLLNQMILDEPGEYITFRQCAAEGGKVKKGAKAQQIFFFKRTEIEVKNPDTGIVEKKFFPVLRYYNVFKVSDCEGIETNFEPDLSPLSDKKEPQKCKAAEAVLKDYVARTGLSVKNIAQNSAYYSPKNDEVVLPLKKQFDKKAEYYSTLFHELTHSTGHPSRLNRFKDSPLVHSKKEQYSLEELVAEIGASYALYNLGIETKSSIRNNQAYIQGWANAISAEPRMVVNAASRASKAVDMIFGIERTYGRA